MVEYRYNVDLEMFRRVDNRGPSLPFNITEARRIESMMNLGMKAPSILKKIDFVNEVSMTNLRTFMNNLEDGNILGLDEDYPVPNGQFVDLDSQARLTSLEERVTRLENSQCDCTTNKNIKERIKKWL